MGGNGNFGCYQARMLGNYLHRMPQDNGNEPQNDLIREFSLQLIHEPMIITANDFFNIDFDLLGSVNCDFIV